MKNHFCDLRAILEGEVRTLEREELSVRNEMTAAPRVYSSGFETRDTGMGRWGTFAFNGRCRLLQIVVISGHRISKLGERTV